MNTSAFIQSSKFIALVIMLTALSRLLPHPYNFTPIAAMALFGGAYLQNQYSAVGITLISMLLSDIMLQVLYGLGLRSYPGFYSLMPIIYLSLAAITLVGSRLTGRISAWTVPLASLTASVLFFVISNFGVFLLEKPHTYFDFARTYTDAIPFFANTLAGDLVYSSLLFGVYEWAKKHNGLLTKTISIR